MPAYDGMKKDFRMPVEFRSIRVNTPISGSVSLVGGIDSATSIRNTVIDKSVVIPSVTYSMRAGKYWYGSEH